MAVFLYQWLGILLLLLPARGGDTTVARHPFYLSVTEISHNGSDKTLEISCKMFAEDLEAILEKNNNVTLDITTGQDEARFNQYIPPYVLARLGIDIDGRKAALNFVGYEVEKESVYCYFEVKNLASVKKAVLKNSLLHDFSKEQINIIHFTANGKRQSARLLCPESNTAFSF